jgi:hypothetical protein
VIHGGKGNDKIDAGKGNDLVNGGKGNDTINGGKGHDVISGGSGNDKLNGGAGNDVIKGGKGNDVISGGAGNDALKGGSGNDKIDGGKGNDYIDGGKGNDVLKGGEGNDVIKGGKGNDHIDGGKGIDTVVYDGKSGDYKVTTKDGTTYVVGKDGTDTLKNVEGLKFADKFQEIPEAPKEKWTVSEVKDGKATINLDGKYEIVLTESNMQVDIKNLCTEDKTRIWGDPHVDVKADGKNDWDFKKDMTFQLADGTKITVNTVDGANQDVTNLTGVSYSSGLTITKGDNAISVTGLAGGIDGANNLKVTQSHDGKALDAKTPDGLVVKETKGDWTTADGKRVDQHVINNAEKAA